jgi:hypothetical protein
MLGGEFIKRFDYRPASEDSAATKATTWLGRYGPMLCGLKQIARKRAAEQHQHGT